MTEPEKRLWWHLRHRLPAGDTHFRPQVLIAGFVADCGCLAAKLVIEVDGAQHSFDANARRDAERSRILEARGFRVLRFSNREVMTSIEAVLETIHAALSSPLAGEVSAKPTEGGAGAEGAAGALCPAPPTPLGLRPSRPSPPGGGEVA